MPRWESTAAQAKLDVLKAKGCFQALRNVNEEARQEWPAHAPPLGLTHREVYRTTPALQRQAVHEPDEDVLEFITQQYLSIEETRLKENEALQFSELRRMRTLLKKIEAAERFSNSASAIVRLDEWTDDFTEAHDAGDPTTACTKCGALLFPDEWTSPKHGICCHGKINIPRFKYIDDVHKEILTDQKFRPNALKINNFYALATAKHTSVTTHKTGLSNMQVEGKGVKKLVAISGDKEERDQLWLMDGDGEYVGTSYKDKVSNIQHLYDKTRTLLLDKNRYANELKQAIQVLDQNVDDCVVAIQLEQVRTGIKRGNEFDNKVCENELRAIYKVAEDEADTRMEYAFWKLNDEEQIINDMHPLYEPLLFPLFFPDGDETMGWRIASDWPGDGLYKNVSALQYGCFHLFDRQNCVNPVLRCGRLTEFFQLHCALRSMTQRLAYNAGFAMRYGTKNQFGTEAGRKEIREKSTNVAPMTTSFNRGERARQQNLNDSLALNSRLGIPDYFITMTANPQWPEIKRNIEKDEDPNDRAALIHRVFNIKMKALENRLMEGALGTYIAMVRSVEYQKRGLPHLHLLLWVAREHKPDTVETLDLCVHAELPDQNTQPKLFQLVTTLMMHQRCDVLEKALCKTVGNDGKPKCKTGFPKAFQEESLVDAQGEYKKPKRPDNKRVFDQREAADYKRCQERGFDPAMSSKLRDNRYVVPYNAALLRWFETHLNVEVVYSPKAIKYLFKYLQKGPETGRVQIRGDKKDNKVSEPLQYLNGLYLGATEACGYLLSTQMVLIKPPVTRLDVHLEGEQVVYYKAGEEEEAADKNPITTLLGWFEANTSEASNADYKGVSTLLYIEMPEYFAWDSKKKRWNKRAGYVFDEAEQAFVTTDRSRAAKKRPQGLGRYTWTPPRNAELQSFRMLLTSARGAKGYEEIRTVDDVKYNTFKEAAAASGLLDDNCDLVRKTMDDAVKNSVSSKYLRFTLAVLIIAFEVSAEVVKDIWNEHLDAFCMKPAARSVRDAYTAATDEDINDALIDLRGLLMQQTSKNDLKMAEFGFEEPRQRQEQMSIPYTMRSELMYNKEEQWQMYKNMQLNTKQQTFVDTVVAAISNQTGGLFLLQGAAGTGKTHTYKALLSFARSHRGVSDGSCEKPVALAVASSGIAAQLLPGGRTAHNLFKIPLNIPSGNEGYNKLCNLEGPHEKLFQMTALIIWDEVVMAARETIEIVDRTLQKVMKNKAPFGGIVVVLGGDFKQILPVKEGKTSIIGATLHCSPLWKKMQKFSLTEIMRQKEDKEYANYVSTIGDGSINSSRGSVRLYAEMYITGVGTLNRRRAMSFVTRDDLIAHTFPELKHGKLSNTLIVCPTNIAQRETNQQCLDQMPGDEILLIAKDKCILEEPRESNQNQAEISDDVMSRVVEGLPLHTIRLKVGCPIMLMKNLDPPNGLCNGTRLIVVKATKFNLLCKFLTPRPGQENDVVSLSRLPCDVDPKKVGFTMQRIQFPVMLSFASTINKSQGQTLDKVGIDLTSGQCFSHGQLYVALSRCRNAADVKVAVPLGTHGCFPVLNPVYTEVFSDIGDAVEGLRVKLTDEERQRILDRLSLSDRVYAEMMHNQSGTAPPDQQFREEHADKRHVEMIMEEPAASNASGPVKKNWTHLEQKRPPVSANLKPRRVVKKRKASQPSTCRALFTHTQTDEVCDWIEKHAPWMINAYEYVLGDGNCFFYALLRSEEHVCKHFEYPDVPQLRFKLANSEFCDAVKYLMVKEFRFAGVVEDIELQCANVEQWKQRVLSMYKYVAATSLMLHTADALNIRMHVLSLCSFTKKQLEQGLSWTNDNYKAGYTVYEGRNCQGDVWLINDKNVHFWYLNMPADMERIKHEKKHLISAQTMLQTAGM